jgi:hypothetical protein
MNNNIIDSIEWHKGQLETLLSEDDFGKVESELDEIVEKFRLPGSKDKTKRKSKKGLKDIISDAFGGKKGPKGGAPSDPGRAPEGDVDARLRNAKRAQIHSRSRTRMG